jgi:hypothetical protein
MNVTRRDEGQVLQVLGDRVTVKLPSGRSPNGMSIVDVVLPSGSGTPCVTHDKEEKVYFLLEGELLMHTPTARHRLHPGDLIHLRRSRRTAIAIRASSRRDSLPGPSAARWTGSSSAWRTMCKNCRATFRACMPQWILRRAPRRLIPADPRKDLP